MDAFLAKMGGAEGGTYSSDNNPVEPPGYNPYKHIGDKGKGKDTKGYEVDEQAELDAYRAKMGATLGARDSSEAPPGYNPYKNRKNNGML